MSEGNAISRRRAIQLAGASGAASLAGCLGGGGGSGGGNGKTSSTTKGKEYTWKVAHWLPPSHPLIKEGLNPLMKRTKKNLEGTNYNIKFDVYPGSQLGEGSEMLRMAKNDSVALTLTSPTYIKGALDLSAVGALPALFKNGMESSMALFEMIKKGGILFENDFKPEGVRPVYLSNISPYQVAGVDDQIKKVDSFKGRKVRNPGGIQAEAMKKLGATPVTMEASNLSTGLERGTFSLTVSPVGSIKGHSWHKPLDWSTTNTNIGGFPFSFTMNLNRFNSLPKTVQDAIMKAGESASKSGGKAYDETAKSFVNKVDGKEIDFYEVPENNLKGWNERLAPLIDDWISNRKNKGLPAQKTVDRYKKLVAKYGKGIK